MNRVFKLLILVTLLIGISFSFSNAETIVEEIKEDTIWTKENSPYIINEIVVVPEGVTLTITEGVEVVFNAGWINCQGKIIARGNTNDLIKFYSPNKQYWCVNLESDNNIFENCSFENSYWAVLNFHYSNNNIINHCIFTNNEHGIKFGNSSAKITNSLIYDNYNVGIYYDGCGSSTRNILENSIIKNNIDGVFITGSKNITISNCDIYNNYSFNIRTNTNNTTNEFDVINCYFGTTNEEEIKSKIFDYEDNKNCPKVNFKPYLLNPFNQVISNYLSGTYGESITVALSVYAKDYNILYTTNGISVMEDVYNAQKYNNPILITKDTTLSTVSVYESVYGNLYGEEQIFTYTIETNSSSGGGDSSNLKTNEDIVINTSIDTTTNMVITNISDDEIDEILDLDTNSVKIYIPKTENVNGYKTILPSKILKSDNITQIEIDTEIAKVSLKNNILLNDVNVNSNVGLNIIKVDKTELDTEISNKIGDKPIIELNLEIDGQKIEWSNPDSSISISIPYTPSEEELKNPEKIVVWYIDSNKNIFTIPNGVYDHETQTVNFEINHFSHYAINYVNKTFNDITEEYSLKHPIEVLAAKGIINGINENKFCPNDYIKRADFILILQRAFELNAKFNNNFDDVNVSDYYYNALGIAKELDIIHGVGNNKFNPNEYLSGEEVNIIIDNISKIRNVNYMNINDCLKNIQTKKLITRAEVCDLVYNLIKK